AEGRGAVGAAVAAQGQMVRGEDEGELALAWIAEDVGACPSPAPSSPVVMLHHRRDAAEAFVISANGADDALDQLLLGLGVNLADLLAERLVHHAQPARLLVAPAAAGAMIPGINHGASLLVAQSLVQLADEGLGGSGSTNLGRLRPSLPLRCRVCQDLRGN